MTQPDPDAAALAAYLHEVGHLQRTAREGWWIAGIKDPESVSEHSHRTSVIAMVIAVMEGADPFKAAALAAMHDVPETRTGDVPSIGRPFVETVDPVEVAKAQTAALPEAVAALLCGLVREFEHGGSREADCAKDADKIDCLLRAREYQDAGNPQVRPWVETSANNLRTATGRRLAAAAESMPANAWWYDIVANYGRHKPTDGG